ncbi:MAG: DNA-processing protein DprA [Bacteroidales bacterium]|nr:DNA-processing protein DprA [Bacteroidales bacterium]
MEAFDEKTCLCALNRIFGFEPRIGQALIENIGSAADIFGLTGKEIDGLTGPFSTKYKGKISKRAYDEAAEELHRLSGKGIRFIGCNEKSYPSALKECEDYPLGLYFRGSSPPEEVFINRKDIAVVGTRDISPYGREWCRRIVDTLAASDIRPTIVSGLAIGTDICAHTAALENDLPTIAVMATGPDKIYPCRHMDFAERLVCTPGSALVTDYPSGTAPLAPHFLRRNRIIAGLSDATILVESRIKGGGMTTARLAFSYNRDVFALPGRVDDIRSQGCNYLIKNKIAEPITSSEALMESLGLPTGKTKRERDSREVIEETYGRRMSSDRIREMAVVLMAIRHERGINIDELAAISGLGYSRTADIVGILETDGLITVDLLRRCHINFFRSK